MILLWALFGAGCLAYAFILGRLYQSHVAKGGQS
jgi:hypothetical protein